MPVDDAHISVRFKHGIHTIFLLVDSLAPFSAVTEELLDILRERYPSGLSKSTSSPERSPLPVTVESFVYGMLTVPDDPSKGWRRLDIGERQTHTPTKCGLENNSVVAFTFTNRAGEDEDMNDDGDDVEFEVEWPQEEDDEMLEQEE